MNIEIINKLDEITNIIENDAHLKRMKQLRKKIENDKELITKINKVKETYKYSKDYIELKNQITQNQDFKEYKNLENDLYFVVLEINKKLNSLKEKSECN